MPMPHAPLTYREGVTLKIATYILIGADLLTFAYALYLSQRNTNIRRLKRALKVWPIVGLLDTALMIIKVYEGKWTALAFLLLALFGMTVIWSLDASRLNKMQNEAFGR